MKKFMKALAVFAAMAMLAGTFVSCSSDDDSSDSKPAVTKYKCDGCGTEYGTEAEKNNCAKQAGCPKYVAGATKYTCDGCGTEYDTEEEKNNCAKQAGCPKYEAVVPAEPQAVTYDSTALTEADLTTIGVAEWASKLYNFPIATEMTTKELSNNVVVGWKGSKAGVLRFRAEAAGVANITSLNYNGGLGNAGDMVAVGSKITATIDRYVGVKTVAGTAYTYKLTGFVTGINKAEAAKNGALVDTGSLTGKVALVAADNTVLAVHELELNKGATTWKDVNQELTGSITATDTEVRVVFSREGAQKYKESGKTYSGSGGFDVVKLELTPSKE